MFALFAVSLMASPFAVPAGTANCNLSNGIGSGCTNQQVGANSSIPTQFFQCTSGFVPCFTGALPNYASISCSTSDQPNPNGGTISGAACLIISNVCYVYPPLQCVFTSIFGGSNTYMASGYTVQTLGSGPTGTQTVHNNVSSYSVFNDWTIILVGLTVAACVASIAILGSGVQLEGVHILFLMTGLLIPWTILTITSGFGSADPSSFWNGLGGYGSLFYAVLSLVYMIGAVKGVSRGGG